MGGIPHLLQGGSLARSPTLVRSQSSRERYRADDGGSYKIELGAAMRSRWPRSPAARIERSARVSAGISGWWPSWSRCSTPTTKPHSTPRSKRPPGDVAGDAARVRVTRQALRRSAGLPTRRSRPPREPACTANRWDGPCSSNECTTGLTKLSLASGTASVTTQSRRRADTPGNCGSVVRSDLDGRLAFCVVKESPGGRAGVRLGLRDLRP